MNLPYLTATVTRSTRFILYSKWLIVNIPSLVKISDEQLAVPLPAELVHAPEKPS
jgi:hypothetical protein